MSDHCFALWQLAFGSCAPATEAAAHASATPKPSHPTILTAALLLSTAA
jgi:hypothetical protein